MTAQRNISPSLASVVELLELDQPRVVTTEDVARYARDAGLEWAPLEVVRRLRERGWLLALKTKGVWEFAPAARAGAFGAGDPFIELRAALRRDSTAPYAVAAESAAYLLGLSTRQPDREVIGAPAGARPAPALKEYRSVVWTPVAPLVVRDGLPVWGVDTLLSFMAAKQADFHDWPNVGDWIRQACRSASVDALRSELAGRSRAAWARAAHLLATGDRPDLADELFAAAPAGRGPYYLGVREAPGRYDGRYEVRDSTTWIAEDR